MKIQDLKMLLCRETQETQNLKVLICRETLETRDLKIGDMS